MNITIYTLNNWLVYLIYLHKGFISVIMIIAVHWITLMALHAQRKPDTTLELRE